MFNKFSFEAISVIFIREQTNIQTIRQIKPENY